MKSKRFNYNNKDYLIIECEPDSPQAGTSAFVNCEICKSLASGSSELSRHLIEEHTVAENIKQWF